MTVGELIAALCEIDPATIVVVAQSRRATWTHEVIRDVRDARCASAEDLGEMRMANETFYGARGIGDPVTRLVISADKTETPPGDRSEETQTARR